MKKITFLLMLFLFTVGSAFSQCIGTVPYLTRTAVNNGTVQSISTCNFGGDYNTINGLLVGSNYQFTSSAAYVTITDLSNNPLGFGPSPVVVNNMPVTSIRLHTHSSPFPTCGTASTCFTTTLQNLTPPPPPANDLCANAIVLTGDGTVAGTTSNATVDTPVACNAVSVTAPGVWYSFTDVSGGGSSVTINTCSAVGYDTKLSVFSGSCGALTCVTANDDAGADCTISGNRSEVTFMTDGSSTYYVLVHGFSANSGNFELNISGFPTITMGDPPVIACPADIVVNNDPGTCGAVANFAGVAFDTEDGNISANIIATPPSGSVFPVGNTIVTLSVTDSDNNTSTCDFNVTVLDNENPVAVCQDITIDLDPVTGIANITGADIDNGSTDNCGIASLTLDVSSFDCSMTGANTVVMTVTDNSGNTATCTATVTVQDVTAPEIVCIGGVGTFTESEDFEGSSVPAGWSTNIVLGSTDWSFGSGDMPTGGDFPTNAAIFDDDAAGSGDNIAELLSPVYDLTGATSAELSFDYAIQDFIGLGLLRGEVWDGSAWQEIFLADDADVNPTNTGAIDVLSYANANFQVKFTWDDETGWNWGAGVDNFLLTYEAGSGGGLDVYLDANGMASIDPNDLLINVNEACGYTVTAGGVGGGTAGSLSTLFIGTNGGSSGWTVMYDVTVGPADIQVTELDINTTSTSAFDLDLYVITGTYVGNETNAAAWGAPVATGSGVGAGTDLPSNVVLDAPVVLSANTTYGFAVVTTGVGQRYTNGDGTNQNFSNADLSLSLGTAVAGLFTGSVFTPRVWNGTVHYETLASSGLEFTCADIGENIVEVTVTDDSGNVSTCFATVNVI
ncbi:HYR domain-containing protein, partial [Aequorivita sp. SDUM287046]